MVSRMSIEPPARAFDKPETFRFGRSRQIFRGTLPDLSGDFLACAGGTETFGRFVARPWPAALSARLGMAAANFGTSGAGPTFFLKDPVLLETLSRARVCILQLTPAWATSNRLFSVRKRRNERLQSVAQMLRLMYPEIDPDRFRFVHRMLAAMHATDPVRFRMVEHEMREAWLARMHELLDQIETRKVLLWFAQRRPEEEEPPELGPMLRLPPAYVGRDMVEALRPLADAVVECVPDGGAGMVLRLDRPQLSAELVPARLHPGQELHDLAAARVAEAVGALIG
ncbi:MAG: hypothetical protein KatS3mg118_2886 [Paracoccaceae bacterium]|nr:MAG: hypothetical protein KatS3mg118_2886 [Paracoccaceae bacterium]